MAPVCAGYTGRYRDDRLEIDFEKRLVLIDSQALKLTQKEYELLSALAAHAGRTISHAALLERVWGYRTGTRTRTLDVHICRLRKKLAAAGRDYIETIFGTGTRFQAWDESADEMEMRQAS